MIKVNDLSRLSRLLQTGIFLLDENGVIPLGEDSENNPLLHSEKLRNHLIEKARRQSIPYIFMNKYQVCFLCVSHENVDYLAGPVSLWPLDRIDLHHYYQLYEIPVPYRKPLKYFTLSQMLDMVNFLSSYLTGKEYTNRELLCKNDLVKNGIVGNEESLLMFDLAKDDTDVYHHTYQEERQLLDSIREGRCEAALRYVGKLDESLGKLSSKGLNHWKNVAIVGITLCTRAAIEGGVAPAVAYRISDHYIQKSDACHDTMQVLEYRNQAVFELTERVRNHQSGRSRSNYIERCKDYIAKNFRQKINLSDLAADFAISPSYLSRLFRQETGVTLQDYIQYVRVEHAANLLTYSDESLARIAEYAGFPTQSYFGKIFKKYKGMSPKKYRDFKKPVEFLQGGLDL